MGTDQERDTPNSLDPRGVRLWDVRDGQKIVVTCTCGQIAHFLPGVLQRLHKLPSDTLVYDLRYRLRCQKCRSRDQFTVSIEGDKWPPA